jgi:hypothetical protein
MNKRTSNTQSIGELAKMLENNIMCTKNLKMKLTKNQDELKSCLTDKIETLSDICDKYALIQAKKGFNPDGNVWKSKVSRIIQALIVHGVAEKQGRGLYRLNQKK